MKQKFKLIPTKFKGIKEKHFSNLIELQNFEADCQEIWVAKFCDEGKHMATGGRSGILKIWSVNTEVGSLMDAEVKGLPAYFNFFQENPCRVYSEHTEDIIDMSWHTIVSEILIKVYNYTANSFFGSLYYNVGYKPAKIYR